MKFLSRFPLLSVLLATSVFFETLSYTYMQQYGRTYYYSSSIIYFLSGLAICLLPLLKSKSENNLPFSSKYVPHLFFLLFVGLLVYHITMLSPLFERVTIDAKWADMIPSIIIACKRFLSGQVVYAPAPEIRDGAIIPYLPTMWIPFLPSIIFGFDVRWTTVAMLFICLFIVLVPLLKSGKKISILPSLITCIALFLLLNYFLQIFDLFWSMSQEGVVAGFYMLLAMALLHKNYVLIGIALTGCMLSRYSLLFWIPLYFGFVFLTEHKNNFWKLFIAFSVSMLLLFVLPFFIHDPAYFFHIPSTYAGAISGFWKNLQVEEGLFYNVGFYKFFTFEQIPLMFKLEIATSFIVPLVFLLALYFHGKKNSINSRYIAFGSLKITLLFFYGFVQAPFVYLFIVPTIISYVLMFDFLTRESIPNETQL